MSVMRSAAYVAGQAAKVGWFTGQYVATRVLANAESRLKTSTPSQPLTERLRAFRQGRRVRRALTQGMLKLFAEDLASVRWGAYRLPRDLSPKPGEALGRAADYFRDLPAVMGRRGAEDEGALHGVEVVEADPARYPDYYLQAFHHQTGGWLTEGSAKLYDQQVEVLFTGAAAAMRRRGLGPIVQRLKALRAAGGDNRPSLLDVGCGTGAFLAEIRDNAPDAELIGLDLSPAYLTHADAAHPGAGIDWLEGNAEAIPLPDGSVDVVTSVYLFHELPRPVRDKVMAEMVRVLRPGGLLVLVDSLQLGDTPALDPALRGFPQSFHEPYYLDWLEQNAPRMIEEAGVTLRREDLAWLSKVFVADKPD